MGRASESWDPDLLVSLNDSHKKTKHLLIFAHQLHAGGQKYDTTKVFLSSNVSSFWLLVITAASLANSTYACTITAYTNFDDWVTAIGGNTKYTLDDLNDLPASIKPPAGDDVNLAGNTETGDLSWTISDDLTLQTTGDLGFPGIVTSTSGTASATTTRDDVDGTDYWYHTVRDKSNGYRDLTFDFTDGGTNIYGLGFEYKHIFGGDHNIKMTATGVDDSANVVTCEINTKIEGDDKVYFIGFVLPSEVYDNGVPSMTLTSRDTDSTFYLNMDNIVYTNDICHDDPLKTSPGQCGCGVADTDTDGDGIADCVDNCPNVANTSQENADNDEYGDACQPSSMPSSAPSQTTPEPSAKPSYLPSSSPSEPPTKVPSSRPSLLPSSNPSAQPSMEPSSQPSARPSSSPSDVPSNEPSARPSDFPSASPSSSPSSSPSNSPSSGPSTSPSSQPSSRPSTLPSNAPSVQPSLAPSTSPSITPSSAPTSQYCQDYLTGPLLSQYYCGKDKYVGVKVPVCIAQRKEIKSSKKSSSSTDWDELDPDGDGYYFEYDTKCMKIDDIQELEEKISDEGYDKKHIESCGCCASGLEDEHSGYCHNVFYHGTSDALEGGESPAPSMEPTKNTGKSEKSGKGSKRQRRRYMRARTDEDN